MKAIVIRMPATGWCVRAGAGRAHFLWYFRGRRWSACGHLERIELYLPQRLYPRQSKKLRCLACEIELARRKVGT